MGTTYGTHVLFVTLQKRPRLTLWPQPSPNQFVGSGVPLSEFR